MKPLTLTIDLEDPTECYSPNGRYVQMTNKILALCEETGRKATFFTIGRVGLSAPKLIKHIASKGHEIAYHSHAHLSLTDETPERFRRETAQDKDRLEQLSGQAVMGFRAPRFSMTLQTLWTTDVLKELGFLYSSSIMPTSISRFGFADAPTTPFCWPSGLIEIPLPMAQFAGLRIPYSGGIYLYALPSFVTQWMMNGAKADEVLWTYLHPYDLDRKESYIPMPNTPNWVAIVLWMARTQAEKKIRKLLVATAPAATMAERVKALAAACPPLAASE